MALSKTLNLDTPFPSLELENPSGGWTLYFYPAKETRWHIDCFKVVAKNIKTFRELAEVLATFKPTDWTCGKFSFTPDHIPPLWENSKNVRGGAYSLRVDRGNVEEVMKRYMVAAVLGQVTNNPANLISCISIKPRTDFILLHIWNRDCQKFNSPSDLTDVDSKLQKTDFRYTPHVTKKF